MARGWLPGSLISSALSGSNPATWRLETVADLTAVLAGGGQPRRLITAPNRSAIVRLSLCWQGWSGRRGRLSSVIPERKKITGQENRPDSRLVVPLLHRAPHALVRSRPRRSTDSPRRRWPLSPKLPCSWPHCSMPDRSSSPRAHRLWLFANQVPVPASST